MHIECVRRSQTRVSLSQRLIYCKVHLAKMREIGCEVIRKTYMREVNLFAKNLIDCLKAEQDRIAQATEIKNLTLEGAKARHG